MVFGTSHVETSRVTETLWSPLIATVEAIHATGMQSNRIKNRLRGKDMVSETVVHCLVNPLRT